VGGIEPERRGAVVAENQQTRPGFGDRFEEPGARG
jgi:hypothetical protein